MGVFFFIFFYYYCRILLDLFEPVEFEIWIRTSRRGFRLFVEIVWGPLRIELAWDFRLEKSSDLLCIESDNFFVYLFFIGCVFMWKLLNCMGFVRKCKKINKSATSNIYSIKDNRNILFFIDLKVFLVSICMQWKNVAKILQRTHIHTLKVFFGSIMFVRIVRA